MSSDYINAPFWMCRKRWILIALFFLTLINGAARALRGLTMSGGGPVLAGSAATLSCSYDLEGAPLYSIRWYRNDDEFYRYVPKESPPSLVFSLPGIHVDLSASNDQKVTLTGVHRQLTGIYHCEVSADAPLFHTDIESARLEIVDVPEYGPYLVVDRSRYAAGDVIRANCTAPVSYPPANLTWYLNDLKINNTITQNFPPMPDLWEASSSLSIIEIDTEEKIQHPRYQVGGNQQEISSSQLKIPSRTPDVTEYTSFTNEYYVNGQKLDTTIDKAPTMMSTDSKFKAKVMHPGPGANDFDLGFRDYPLRVPPVPLKISKVQMPPRFVGALNLRCEATIYDIYKSNTDTYKIKEETPHTAHVMEQNSAGCSFCCRVDQWCSIVALASLHTVWKTLISCR